MPKIRAYTERQRRESADQRFRDALADGLAAYKNRTGQSQEQIGKELGVSISTVRKIRKGEPVEISTDSTYRLLRCAGYKIVREEQVL